jgi:hypothetical protein
MPSEGDCFLSVNAMLGSQSSKVIDLRGLVVIPDFANKTKYSSHVFTGSFIPDTRT